jgi:hypothetical protein
LVDENESQLYFSSFILANVLAANGQAYPFFLKVGPWSTKMKANCTFHLSFLPMFWPQTGKHARFYESWPLVDENESQFYFSSFILAIILAANGQAYPFFISHEFSLFSVSQPAQWHRQT